MDIKTVAMYLPQFYETEDNNRWWGKGFTDWTAVRNARNLYEGHIQPRAPFNNNYYDLSEPDTLREQAALARQYGIYGFCFYHYYFGKGRLQLQKPAENLLGNPDIDINYCFCWANESWSRSWSGIQNGNSWASSFEDLTQPHDNMLIEQDYGDETDWREHFDYLVPFFRDPRYIKVDDKPVIMIYRPELIDSVTERLRFWKTLAEEQGLSGLYVIGVNFREAADGFDAVLMNAPRCGMRFTDTVPTGPRLFRAEDVWETLLESKRIEGIRTYFGGFVDYDDTPRHGTRGIAVTGNSPAVFRRYLSRMMRKNAIEGNDIQFLNAWNEWGEGNALEPDSRFGYGYLEAVRDIYETNEYYTEKEFALTGFADRFGDYKGKKIYIFGTGANAATVIDRYDEVFRFCGLIDDGKSGECVFGKRVISLDEATGEEPDLIIVAAQISSEINIMDRDGERLKECKADLRDMYGNDLRKLFGTDIVRASASRDDYLSSVERCDVLSLDLADTLLKRDILHAGEAFVCREAQLLCEHALSFGKEVVFVMDDGIPVSGQMKALRAAGLLGKGEIVSESEYGRNKFNGLYRILKNRYRGKKILHIGNDLGADVIAPRVYGMDSLGFPAGTARSGQRHPAVSEAFADKRELIESIDSHDTICFDIFDTLITRRCLCPEDVFVIVGETSREDTGIEPGLFARYRLGSQERVPDGNICDIYEEFQKLSGIDDETRDRLVRLEIDTEKRLTVPRRDVVGLLRSAVRKNKKVILITDMYLPEDVIRDILKINGITGFSRIIVSCECGMRKRTGLFGAIGEPGSNVLMIGDDYADDCLSAREYGFDAFPVSSCAELALNNGFREIIDGAGGVSESLFIGSAVSRLFNSPFGISDEDRDAAAAESLVMSYISWLVLSGAAAESDGILFQERDGYLFRKIYEYVRRNIPDVHIPVSVSLPISRAAAIKLCEDRVDVDSLYSLMKDDSDVKSLMTDFFGIEEDCQASVLFDGSEPFSERFSDAIRIISADQREAFFRMISSKRLKMGKEYGLFDFYSGGFVQACLSEVVPFDLKGLYYGINSKNTMTGDIKAISFLEDAGGLISEDYVYLERIITAPEASVKGYRDGKAERFPENRSREELTSLRRSQKTALDDCMSVMGLLTALGKMTEPQLMARLISEISRS